MSSWGTRSVRPQRLPRLVGHGGQSGDLGPGAAGVPAARPAPAERGGQRCAARRGGTVAAGGRVALVRILGRAPRRRRPVLGTHADDGRAGAVLGTGAAAQRMAGHLRRPDHRPVPAVARPRRGRGDDDRSLDPRADGDQGGGQHRGARRWSGWALTWPARAVAPTPRTGAGLRHRAHQARLGRACRTGHRPPAISCSICTPGAGWRPNTPQATASPSVFRYDPADPTPTVGGRLLTRDSGYRDDTALALRDDVVELHQRPPAGTAVRVRSIPSSSWPTTPTIRISTCSSGSAKWTPRDAHAMSATGSGGSVRRPTGRSASNSTPWRTASARARACG